MDRLMDRLAIRGACVMTHSAEPWATGHVQTQMMAFELIGHQEDE
jgi:hypothetical protein